MPHVVKIKERPSVKAIKIPLYYQWILIALLCVQALYLNLTSSSLERIATIYDGIGTCFGRIGDSYRSKITNQKDHSLTRKYFSNTDACFSRAVSYIEENFSKNIVSALAPINTLATEAHWFHQRLQKSKGQFLNTHFSGIEKVKTDLLLEIEKNRKKKSISLARGWFLFFSILGLSLSLMILSLLFKKKENIVTTPPLAHKAETKTIQVSVPPQIALADVLGNVLDLLTSKIFARGIRINLKINEKISLDKSGEALEQIFYHLLTYLLDIKSNEEISITSSNDKKGVGLNIYASLQEELKQEHLLLQVAKGLINETKGEISFSQGIGEDKKVKGIQIEIYWPKHGPKKVQRKIKYLKKGKKREILSQVAPL